MVNYFFTNIEITNSCFEFVPKQNWLDEGTTIILGGLDWPANVSQKA